MRPIPIDGRSLTPAHVHRILAGQKYTVKFTEKARARVVDARQVVEKALADGRTVYGVTTGFGKLADKRIPPGRVRELQRNLLLSHACGVGRPLPDEIVGLALLFRANALTSSRVAASRKVHA